MEDIVEPSISHDFSTLCLGPPTTVAGGSYFTRIMHKNNKPLYVQTPKCFSKQGFIKSGKRIYADLMFDNNDTIFIDWIERLEAKCQELIYIKGEKWFQTRLEKDDIETAFTSPLKVYKSGKFYLLRINVKPNIKIYNESDKIVNLEEIVDTNSLISILEIQGIKFTSRNFQIEIELKQSLVVSPDPFLDTCFIKKPARPTQTQSVVAETKEIYNTNTNTNTRILDILKSENDVPDNDIVDLNESFTLETVLNAKEPKIIKPSIIESSVIEPSVKVIEPKVKVIEPKVIEPSVIESKVIEPKVIEPKVIEPKVIEPKVIEPKVIEPKVIEPNAKVNEPNVKEKEDSFANNLDLKELNLSLEEFDFDEDFDAKTAANTAANSSLQTNTLVENVVSTTNSPNSLEQAISLDITELDLNTLDPMPNNELEEISMPSTVVNDLETLTLKKPNQVYHEIYQKAREKAKAAKKEAMLAYLEVKNIKKTYMLDNMDDSDSDIESDY